MMTLDNEIYTEVLKLSKKGEVLFNREDFTNAIEIYKAALLLLPNPKSNWEASIWLYAAIGDSHFMMTNYSNAKEIFFDALSCPGGNKNPFISLRLGQCFFELKEFSKADEYLMRAYMLDGKKVFKGEPIKYLSYLKQKYDL